jgi:tetratricopeptide (TPR) repeat protein
MRYIFLLVSFISFVLFSGYGFAIDIFKPLTNYQESKNAYETYKSGYLSKKNYESAWEFAAIARFFGNYFVKDVEAKKKIFEEAKDAALFATKVNANGVEGHYYLGVAYGSWAEATGIMNSLFLAGPIVDEMTKVINLDPKFRNGSAYAVRARVYQKAPGWPVSIGDREKAQKDFEEAIKYDNRMSYRFYAEFLMGIGEKEEARKIAEKGLNLPPNELEPVADEDEMEILKKLLSSLKN